VTFALEIGLLAKPLLSNSAPSAVSSMSSKKAKLKGPVGKAQDIYDKLHRERRATMPFDPPAELGRRHITPSKAPSRRSGSEQSFSRP